MLMLSGKGPIRRAEAIAEGRRQVKAATGPYTGDFGLTQLINRTLQGFAYNRQSW
jgi:hypothetical protein